MQRPFNNVLNMKKYKKKPFLILFLLIAIVLFSLLSPLLFTNKILFNEVIVTFPEYADELGMIFSIMSPFIAIAAVFATFAAFWTQYRANQEMLCNNEKMQVERQFFEMLRIHKDNVENIEFQKWELTSTGRPFESWLDTISIYHNKSNNPKEIPRYEKIKEKGHQAIEICAKEFEVIDKLLEYYSKKYQEERGENFVHPNRKIWLQRVYNIFYYGKEAITWKDKYYNEGLYEYQYEKISEKASKCSSSELMIADDDKESVDIYKPLLGYVWLKGHSSQMNHYYRQLFLLVKYIVNVDDSLYMTKKEAYHIKRNYLRMLRAQLSSSEQILLFYNWFSGKGYKWENEKNHFFTDYRMIHNIWPNQLSRFNQKELRDLFPPKMQMENENDPLFEFEE